MFLLCSFVDHQHVTIDMLSFGDDSFFGVHVFLMSQS